MRAKSTTYLSHKTVNFVDEGCLSAIFCLKWTESFLKKLKGKHHVLNVCFHDLEIILNSFSARCINFVDNHWRYIEIEVNIV